jgi:hypothetical protein
VVGVATILSNKSTRLKLFAFAGFLYDFFLPLGAHSDQREVKLLVPLTCLAIWGFAYEMDRRVFPISIV